MPPADDDTPPPANVLLMLLRVREALLQSFRPILMHLQLTEQQWRVLRILGERGETEQRTIATTGQFLGPSLVGVLRRMEQSDLVTGSSDERDRRRRLVALTPKGKALYQTAKPLIESQYELLAEHVGAPELQELGQLLRHLEKKLRKPVPTLEFEKAE